MKRITLSLIAAFSCMICSAQWSTAGINIYTANPASNVGLNATATERLSVGGNILIANHDNYLQIVDRLTLQVTNTVSNNYTRSSIGQNIKWNPTTSQWRVDGSSFSDFGLVRFEGDGIGFFTRASTGSSYDITDANLNSYRRLYIHNNGNVGIGTDNPQGYKLAVNGSAIFTSAKVKLFANWPDYVFDYSYSLRPLSEVEQYIRQHHHLPEVPSAAEVKEQGLDLGANQAILLKKIEELTLYVIAQQKEIEALKKELKK